MKKLVLSFFVAASSFVATSQVIFRVQSPSNIAGLYPFTNNGDGSEWLLADLNDPNVAVEDTLMLVEDGTPGLNAQGHPFSQEGCNTLTNDLTGKIAVIYRYDGESPSSCGFGLKARNAQTAGAVGVIIINREPGLVNMQGSTDGGFVNIPVTFISDTDGAILVNAMGSGSVVVFIGNKQNVYGNDLGSLPKDYLIAKAFSNPTLVSSIASEFSIDSLGLTVRNFGSIDQVGATVIANIDFNGSSIYADTTAAFDLLSGDTIVQKFSAFSLPTYTPGRYTLSYQVNLTSTDEDTVDNFYTADFIINDTLFSLAPLDAVRNFPISTGGTQPSEIGNKIYQSCIVYQNPNASRLQAEGIYFSAVTNEFNDLSNKGVPVKAYTIDADFTNLDDPSIPDVVPFTSITTGYFTYPDATTLEDSIVYAAFDNIIALENGQRYLFCVEADSSIFIGYNTKLNYENNYYTHLQPLVPLIKDNVLNLAGFGGDAVPAIAVKMGLNTVGIEAKTMIEGSVYPNPANDEIYISLKAEGSAQLIVTDISGKTVLNNTINLTNGKSKVNINSLSTGMYIFNVVLENGTTSQFNVVKK